MKKKERPERKRNKKERINAKETDRRKERKDERNGKIRKEERK